MPRARETQSPATASPDRASPAVQILWALFIFSLPFSDLLFFPEILVGGGQPSTFLALLLFSLLAFPRPSHAVHILLESQPSRLLLAFLGVSILSTMMSFAAPRSEWKGEILWIKSLKQSLQLLVAYACFAIPLLYVTNPHRLLDAARRYAWTVWFVIVYGAFEVLHFFDWNTELFSWLGSVVHRGSYFGSPRQVNLVYLPSLAGFPRVRLLGSEPSMTGNYLISVLPFLFFCYKTFRSIRWAIAAAGAVTLLFLTFSLGAWISVSLAALAGIALAFVYKQRLSILSAAILASGTAYLFLLGGDRPADSSPLVIPYDVVGRLIKPKTDISVAGRMVENTTAWRLFQDYPLLGVGIGNWVFHHPDRMNQIETDYVHLYKQLTASGFARSAGINNLYLRLLCETGLAGALSFCAFLFLIFRISLKMGWASPTLADLGLALTVSGVALLINFNSMSAFDKRYWWFIFGLVAACGRLYFPRSRRRMPAAAAQAAVSGGLRPAHARQTG